MGALEALGAALLRASLEGAVAVAVVGLIVTLVPRLPAAVRCLLWWAACARFLVALPGWGVAVLPALPAEWSAPAERAASASPAGGSTGRSENTTSMAAALGSGGALPAADGERVGSAATGASGPAVGAAKPSRSGDAAGGPAPGRAGGEQPDRGQPTAATAPRPVAPIVAAGEARPPIAPPPAAGEAQRPGRVRAASGAAPAQGGPLAAAGWEHPPAAPPLAAAAPASQRADATPAVAPPHRWRSLGPRAASLFTTARPWLAALWLVGLAAAALGLGRALSRLRRLVAGARPVTERRLAATLAVLCRRLRLRPPALLASPAVRSPLVVGPARPRVLLPEAGLAEMSAGEAEMVLCHELAHLRRRDLWLGWLPSLARTVFFFHPLAALAAREYVLAREAACDAEVLRVLGSAPRDYGRLLLRWGLAPRESGLAAAAAAPSRHHLKRRLLMLNDHDRAPRRRALLWMAPAAVALLALLPLRLVASEGEAAMLDPSLLAALPSVAWSGDRAQDPPEPPPRPRATPAPAAPAPPPETDATPAPLPSPSALPTPAPQPAPAAAAQPAPPATPGALPTPAPQPLPGVAAPPVPPSPGAPRASTPQPPRAMAAPPAPPGIPGALPTSAPHSPPPTASPAASQAPASGVPRGAAPPAPAAAPRPRTTPAPVAPPTALPGTARQAPFAAPAARSSAAGARPPAPATPPAPPAGAVGRVAGAATATPAARAVAPHPTAAPRAQGGAPAPRAGSSHTNTYSVGNSERGAWVYVEGESRTMSGSSGDAERALAARRGDEPLLYVRRGGDAWVVRDPALLADAKRILEPVLALGRQQGELGGRQGALGGEQGTLGSRQGALGAEQGRLAGEQGRLSAELARLGSELAEIDARRRRAAESERPALAARRQEVRQRMDGLEERMSALSAQQRELGNRQAALGDEQRALGERQRALGDQQRELGERQRAASAAAEEELAALIDRARAAGKAEAVR